MRIDEIITYWNCFDLLSNSLNLFFMEMCRDQSGEFMFFGYKGYSIGDQQLSWFLTTQLRHNKT